ncbi:MAG: VOC family protein, partial [Planctomycetales bacterium]|nr:VOC family protein [Planctomycetales bacterium]NIN07897.1 VOC family protein [Planctomycetales bacterium]NIN77027.1 VOC family protein [Planctomycetales bacterium]NIO34209.1 VOC family protein [Planctomycetales bacterium]NIO46016.1 VOC family protein [Planctomycetales bacterium]
MDRVCLFEIPYTDRVRAEKFYQDVFGWQIYPAPTETPYSFAITTPVDATLQPTQPGGINGGMFPRGGDVGSTTPVVVIEVESCEQRIADVTAAGGAAVMGPVQIAQLGIYAQVRDSEDNIIGLWEPLV